VTPLDDIFDYLINDELGETNYWAFTKQAIPRNMGYASNQYQGENERRRILMKCYNANFIFENKKLFTNKNLITHVEEYGRAKSKERFIRICRYLGLRCHSLIENNIVSRKNGPHRSYRQVYQTFEDGVWFVGKYGREYNYTYYGRLWGERPPSLSNSYSIPINPEPLLIFEIEKLPAGHARFVQKNKKNDGCQGLIINEKMSKEENYYLYPWQPDSFDESMRISNCLMNYNDVSSLICSSCKMDYYSDSVEISEQKYSSHAHLIEYRFPNEDFYHLINIANNMINFDKIEVEDYIQDYIKNTPKIDKKNNYGDTRNLRAMSEDDRIALRKVYLSDHIYPIKADIDEMLGIPGDAIKRYKLDHDLSRNLISEKSEWPNIVRREILKLGFVEVDNQFWSSANDTERTDFLKNENGLTHKKIRNEIKEKLENIIYLNYYQDLKDIVRFVLRELVKENILVRAGKSGGTRHARIVTIEN